MEELTVFNPECKPAVITADFDAMNKALDKELSIYEGVTEEGIAQMDMKESKACRAALKKMSKELNDARIAIKKQYMVSYDEFEKKVKELDARILEPWALIDKVIKQKEEQAKDERYSYLDQTYQEFAPVIYDLIPFEKILESKWLNASTKEKAAEDALTEKVSHISADWNALQNTQLKFREETEAEFIRTCSLQAALDYDAKRQAEAERIASAKETVAQNRQMNEVEIPMYEKVRRFSLVLDMTEKQKDDLMAYLKRNDIHGTLNLVKAEVE